MRDLAKETPRNGPGAGLLLDDEPHDAELTAADLVKARREVRRDQHLAHIATMLLDPARYLDPLVEMLSAKLLRWALTEAVHGLIRSPGFFYNFYRRIKKGQKQRHGIAIMACVRELAEVVWRMLTARKTFQESVPQSLSDEVVAQRLQKKWARENQKSSSARTLYESQPTTRSTILQNLDRVRGLATVKDNPRPIPRELKATAR